MAIKYYDICTKSEYEKNGEKKTKWNRAGVLKVLDDGKMFVEFPIFPYPFYVFEQKPKEESNAFGQ